MSLIARIDEFKGAWPHHDGRGHQLTGASRNTLKQRFRDLIERKHLEQHGSGRGAWYGLK